MAHIKANPDYHKLRIVLGGEREVLKAFSVSTLLPNLLDNSWPHILKALSDLYHALIAIVVGFI